MRPTYTNTKIQLWEKKLKEMADKKFIGQVKGITTQYGEIIKVALGSADLIMLQQSVNEKGWVNLAIKRNKEGKPYMELDTFKPQAKQPERPIDDEPANDLPF